MTTTAIVNVSTLVTNDRSAGRGLLGEVPDAALVVEDGLVAWLGPTRELPEGAGDVLVDAEGRCGLPGFVDSHAHLVFAGDRCDEFVARMRGEPYTAGGIRSTVAATRAAPTAVLEATARALRDEALRAGTTTMESKSGYGLSVDDEVRSLEVAGRVADEVTFLGAHVVPDEFEGDAAGYVGLVASDMLLACAPLARFVDVFCEHGAIEADLAEEVLASGMAAGLRGKVHANQLGHGEGVQLGVRMGAVSVDHCTYLDDADVEALASSRTVATLLPITEFATRSPYVDARRLLDAGARVALATNCNPGSGFSTSMALAIALAVRELGMTPDEAVRAATLGGAVALDRGDVGTLRVGTRGDLVLLDAPSPAYLAYRPGVDLVGAVLRGGEVVRPLTPAR